MLIPWSIYQIDGRIYGPNEKCQSVNVRVSCLSYCTTTVSVNVFVHDFYDTNKCLKKKRVDKTVWRVEQNLTDGLNA